MVFTSLVAKAQMKDYSVGQFSNLGQYYQESRRPRSTPFYKPIGSYLRIEAALFKVYASYGYQINPYIMVGAGMGYDRNWNTKPIYAEMILGTPRHRWSFVTNFKLGYDIFRGRGFASIQPGFNYRNFGFGVGLLYHGEIFQGRGDFGTHITFSYKIPLKTTGTSKTKQATPEWKDSDGTFVSNGPVHIKGQGENMEYRRSSLCSILVRHPERKYDFDIAQVFTSIPIPEKYNDHNLDEREIASTIVKKKKTARGKEIVDKTIKPYIEDEDIAKQLVSKWFNRDGSLGGDGTFDLDLVKERGLYDATYFDEQMAAQSIRGMSLLEDAGEDLIGNTFVIFNDIEYFDKEAAAQWASIGVMVLSLAAQTTSSVIGIVNDVDLGTVSNLNKSISGLEGSITDLNDKIGGFRVTVTTYLYRLRWDDETAGTFYSQYYTSESDDEKKAAYNRDKGTFHLDYIGSYKVKTGKTTLSGVKDQHGMIRKVCQRAIDKNIAQLQKEYEEFRVKTPLFSTTPLSAKIGLKEDITPNSKFEVLEEVEDAEGRTHYRRVGVVKPIKGKIWDNRYMAEYEKENKGSTRTATEFKVVSGRGFYPGMLLRQIK